jgi:hypothetical protein
LKSKKTATEFVKKNGSFFIEGMRECNFNIFGEREWPFSGLRSPFERKSSRPGAASQLEAAADAERACSHGRV